MGVANEEILNLTLFFHNRLAIKVKGIDIILGLNHLWHSIEYGCLASDVNLGVGWHEGSPVNFWIFLSQCNVVTLSHLLEMISALLECVEANLL